MRPFGNLNLDDLRRLAKENWWDRRVLTSISDELGRRTESPRSIRLYEWVANQILELCERAELEDRAAAQSPAVEPPSFSLRNAEHAAKYTCEVLANGQPWGITFPGESVHFRFGIEKALMIREAVDLIEEFVATAGFEPADQRQYKSFACSSRYYSRGRAPGPRLVFEAEFGAKLALTLNQAAAAVELWGAIAEFINENLEDRRISRLHISRIVSGGLPSLGKRRP